MSASPDFPLTAQHLVFSCEAETHIRFAWNKAGAQLRGALSNVMTRAYCTCPPGSKHGEPGCPACWLLAANETPGEERRGYALLPPTAVGDVRPGERFEFALTLFGDAQRYLPYFILSVADAGREGVGMFLDGERGRFALRRVVSLDPFGGAHESVLAESASLVRPPQRAVTHAEIVESVQKEPESGQVKFKLDFQTPTRLIVNDQILKMPDFGGVFKHILLRLDQLAGQFCQAGYRRDLDERLALQAAADSVRLMDARTRWIDVFSGSKRTGNETPIGGFAGVAIYSAPAAAWCQVLPWLLWGQMAQVGKNTVKGNGVYRVERLA